MASGVHVVFHGNVTMPLRTVGFGYPMRRRIISTDSSVICPLIKSPSATRPPRHAPDPLRSSFALRQHLDQRARDHLADLVARQLVDGCPPRRHLVGREPFPAVRL